MKLVKIDYSYVNLEKIIQIYERPKYFDNSGVLQTVIEVEGIETGNTGLNGETPYYSQNKIITDMDIDEVFKIIFESKGYYEK